MKILRTLITISLFAALLWSCASGADKQIEKQLMEQGKYTSVNIKTSTYTSTDKGSHSTKEIVVDGTALDATDRFAIITTAYPIARTAYNVFESRKNLPDTIVVNMDLIDGKRLLLTYESKLMGEREEQVKAKASSFLDAAMHNSYSSLDSFCDPSLDLTSAINLFRQVDSLSNGIARYESVGFNHTTATDANDGSTMSIINAWYYIYTQKDSIKLGVFLNIDAKEPHLICSYTINQQ